MASRILYDIAGRVQDLRVLEYASLYNSSNFGAWHFFAHKNKKNRIGILDPETYAMVMQWKKENHEQERIFEGKKCATVENGVR